MNSTTTDRKSRVRNLSTRYLTLYRYGTILILTALVLLYLYRVIEEQLRTGSSSLLFLGFTFSYLIYIWFRANSKIYKVEFDEDYLYVIQREVDILIPLQNIKDIALKSVGGVWRVDLFHADILGDHFYFKPSLIYPLNHKSKDALVNLLWEKIEAARGRDIQTNALPS